MPSQIRHPEWQSSLEDTNYPFEPDAKLLNSAGDIVPPDVFLDAHFYPIGGSGSMYLSKVEVTAEAVTLYIGDSSTLEIASGSVTITGSNDIVRLTDVYGRPAGIIISEASRLGMFRALGIGEHSFTQLETPFVATVCMPTPQIGVRGIVIPDGTLFTGPVWIVGEDGVVVSKETAEMPATCDTSAQTQDVIRIDVVGDPLFRRRLCVPNDLFATPNFVQKIRIVNGNEQWTCSPDEHGYFYIQGNDSLAGDAALRVRTTTSGELKFEVVGTPNFN
jgi:hypothetical protein|tara:strand:- start:2777 stop:3604 length:828 start_codon:yes stop_codon:yes gene_type:complete